MLVLELTLFFSCLAIVLLCYKAAKIFDAIRQDVEDIASMMHIESDEEGRTEIFADESESLALLKGACRDISHSFALSKREEEMLSYFARGKSSAAIAEELHIGSATVKTHSFNIYQKLGIHSRDELIRIVEARLNEQGTPARSRPRRQGSEDAAFGGGRAPSPRALRNLCASCVRKSTLDT